MKCVSNRSRNGFMCNRTVDRKAGFALVEVLVSAAIAAAVFSAAAVSLGHAARMHARISAMESAVTKAQSLVTRLLAGAPIKEDRLEQTEWRIVRTPYFLRLKDRNDGSETPTDLEQIEITHTSVPEFSITVIAVSPNAERSAP